MPDRRRVHWVMWGFTKRFWAVLLLAAVVYSMPSACTAQGFYLAVGEGAVNLSVKDRYAIDDQGLEDRNLALEWAFGYTFESHAVIEASGAVGVDLSLFSFTDYYAFDDWRVMGGYSFPLGDRFYLVPKLGVGFWNLQEQGGFFLGGPRAHQDFSGEDLVWAIRGEVELSRRFRLYVSYTDADYDFGGATFSVVGVKFQF